MDSTLAHTLLAVISIGGIRVNAFVSGGAVPASERGTTKFGLITAWDWYATMAYLAGVDPTDHRAAAAGLPPIDSINVWPYLAGQVTIRPAMKIGDCDYNCLPRS